jgi:hypothetical protein
VTRVRYIVVLACAVIALYLGATWFFFGSPHPCEILMARQKNHYIERAKQTQLEDVRYWREAVGKALKNKAYDMLDRLSDNYINAIDRRENLEVDVVKALRRKISVLTPSECAWEALTWRG